MEREEALKSLEVIRTMVEQTRKEVDRSGPFLILWGVLIFIACIIQHGLVITGVRNDAPYIMLWVVNNTIGVVGSIIIGYRLRKSSGKIVDSVARKIGGIWAIIVASIVLLAVLSGFGHFPPRYVWAVATLFSGVGLVATGAFTEERIWIVLGILCLPMVALMLIYPLTQFLMFGVFFGVSYITVGIRSSRKYKDIIFTNVSR